jgi:integrase/recombinase XerC
MNNEAYDSPALPVPRRIRDVGVLDRIREQAYTVDDLFEEVVSRNPNTKLAYLNDLRHFCEYCGETHVEDALAKLLRLNQEQANRLLSKWRDDMFGSGLAPNTLNRRLAALRSVIRLAQFRGMIAWKVSVKGLSVQTYRDTEGPGRENVKRMIDHVERHKTDPIRSRDVAILRMLFSMGLRRNEVASLDYADVDLRKRKVKVLRKGKTERIELSIPKSTITAVERWILVRGRENGPLFVHFSRDLTTTTRRLAGNGLFKIVREIGRSIGIETSPHRIRHTSITEAIKNSEKHGIRIDEILQFSGHAKLETMMIYRDNLRNVQGQVADYVDAGLDEPGSGEKADEPAVTGEPIEASRLKEAVGLYYAEGATPDQKDKAIALAEKLAQNGYLPAMHLLSYAYNAQKDFRKAADWLMRMIGQPARDMCELATIGMAMRELAHLHKTAFKDEALEKHWREKAEENQRAVDEMLRKYKEGAEGNIP